MRSHNILDHRAAALRWICLIAASAIFFFAGEATASDLDVLTLGRTYELDVKPFSQAILDLSSIDLNKLVGAGQGPLLLTLSKEGETCWWQLVLRANTHRYILDRDHLKPIGAQRPFEGFAPKQTWRLAISSEQTVHQSANNAGPSCGSGRACIWRLTVK